MVGFPAHPAHLWNEGDCIAVSTVAAVSIVSWEGYLQSGNSWPGLPMAGVPCPLAHLWNVIFAASRSTDVTRVTASPLLLSVLPGIVDYLWLIALVTEPAGRRGLGVADLTPSQGRASSCPAHLVSLGTPGAEHLSVCCGTVVH